MIAAVGVLAQKMVPAAEPGAENRGRRTGDYAAAARRAVAKSRAARWKDLMELLPLCEYNPHLVGNTPVRFHGTFRQHIAHVD